MSVQLHELWPMTPLAALAVAMVGLARLSLVAAAVFLGWASRLALR